MPKTVTEFAFHPPHIVAKCCSFVSLLCPKSTPRAHHEIATSQLRFCLSLRDYIAGRKIAPLHKK
jgi:hypothetical protein